MSTTTPNPACGLVGSTDGALISYETLGDGPGLLVLGGVLRSGRDYLPLARGLAQSFSVHVIDRRGRGRSAPQGADYSIEREVDDLLAVQAHTGAAVVFGHSYGGLIALEAARRSAVFSDLVLYEPGVSVAGSIPLGWMTLYRDRLAAGDSRGAFAAMARGAGHAPRALEGMPLWCAELILRIVIKDHQWRRLEPLLQASLAEHEQVAALDDTTVDRYQAITARVLLLGGRKSPSFATTRLFDQLTAAIPNSASDLIDGLDHTAPDENAPELVADRVRRHLGA